MFSIKSIFKNVDWVLFSSVLLISLAGLITMNSFTGSSSYFSRQIIWIVVSSVVFFIASGVDWSFLKNSRVIVILFFLSTLLLFMLFVVGSVFKGAQSWFDFGAFSFQPVDIVKLVVILLLSKYFSRRHVEIANVRHILVSGLYVFIVFLLVLLQPDFGSAIIIFAVWFGMVMVSGISKKHLFGVFFLASIVFGGLWLFAFKPYQKARIMTFLNPLTDIRGTGYNAYQSTIAVGSGQVFGKGIGYGTQSKLQFLPEYQTDFIFAAFAEEWGFFGVTLLLILYGLVIWRILKISSKGGSNFEMLFGLGLAILFSVHAIIHIGMNIGLLPVTGNTLPFMSYGGSHLMSEFLGLGMMMGMRKSSRSVHKEVAQNELVI
jgi:rod shape determining protein RodA